MANDSSNGGVQPEEAGNQPATGDSKSPKRTKSTRSQTRPKKSKNALTCDIVTLEGESLQIEVDRHANAEVLYSKVISQLNITEKEYFGLRFTDEETKVDRWLDLQKSMKKQISSMSPKFDFCVKFYEPEPARIQDEHTRYLLYLQLRKDIVTGRLECEEKTFVLLGSYTAQAEVGDYDPSEHGVYYLTDYQFSPDDENAALTRKVMELHREQRGQTPAQAELNFLEAAKRIPRYGISVHEAHNKEDDDVVICVSHAGIHIENDNKTTHSFLWPQVDNVIHRRKTFKLRLQKPANKEKIERNFSYTLKSKRASKALYKACIEYHTFFRLTQADPPRKKTEFFKLKSKFRYSDRTLYELRSRSSLNNPSSPTSFSRSPSKRRTICNAPTSSHSPVKSLPRAPIAEQPREENEHPDSCQEQPQDDRNSKSQEPEDTMKLEEVAIDENDPQNDKYPDEEWEIVEKTMPDGSTKRFRRRIITTKTVTTVTTTYVTRTTSANEEDEIVMETKPLECSLPEKTKHDDHPNDDVKDNGSVNEPIDSLIASSLHDEVMATLDMDVVKENTPDVVEDQAVESQPEEISIEERRAAAKVHTYEEVDAPLLERPEPASENTVTTTTTITTTVVKTKKEEDKDDEQPLITNASAVDVVPQVAPVDQDPEEEIETIEMFVERALNLPPDLEEGLSRSTPALYAVEDDKPTSESAAHCELKDQSRPYSVSGIPRSKTLDRNKKPVPDPPRRHSGSYTKHAPATLPRSSKKKSSLASEPQQHRKPPSATSDEDSPKRSKAEAEIKYSLKEDLLLSHEQGERGFVKDQVVQNETIVQDIVHQSEVDQNRPRSRIYTNPESQPSAFKSAIPTRSTTFGRVQPSTVTSVKAPPPVATKPVIVQPVTSDSAVFQVRGESPQQAPNGADDSTNQPTIANGSTESRNQGQALPEVETRTVVFDPNAPPLKSQHSDEGYVEEIVNGNVIRRRVKTVTTVTTTLRQDDQPRHEALKDADKNNDDDFSLDDWVQSNFKPVVETISVEEKRLSRDFLAESPPDEVILDRKERATAPVAADRSSCNSTPEIIDLDEITGDDVELSSTPMSPIKDPSSEARPTCTKDAVVEEPASVMEHSKPEESTPDDNKEDQVMEVIASQGPSHQIETRKIVMTHTTLPSEHVITTIVNDDELTPEQREALLQGNDDAVIVGATTTRTTQVVKTTTVQKVVTGETVTVVGDGESDVGLQQAIQDALRKAGVDGQAATITMTTTNNESA